MKKKRRIILRRVRKKSNVINLEEYCLKEIRKSPSSHKFFQETLDESIKRKGGYGTEQSLNAILEYMQLYHKGAKIGKPYLGLQERGLI